MTNFILSDMRGVVCLGTTTATGLQFHLLNDPQNILDTGIAHRAFQACMVEFSQKIIAVKRCI